MSHQGLERDPEANVLSSDKMSRSGSTSHTSIVPVGRENLSKALPPHETYEGRHRWDPSASWSEKEEAHLVWKTDLRLMSWVCVMVGTGKHLYTQRSADETQFFGLQLDRGNLQNALTDNLLTDLGLTTNDYNNVFVVFQYRFSYCTDQLKGTTIQLVCFLLAEFPVQFLTKRYGFRLVLPTMMMAWSTVCMSDTSR